MSVVRPMRRDDVPGVAALYERVVRSGSPVPAPGLVDWFARTLFDSPWVDPDIPSLVATDEAGGVIAAMGSHVRRLRIDGAPARLAVSGQLVVAPEARSRALGAVLMKTYLAGPQELTLTDGATDVVRLMWERLGGDAAPLQALEWWRPLRPWTSVAAAWQQRRQRSVSGRVRAVAAGLDRATPARFKPIAVAASGSEPLTATALVAELPSVTHRLRLFPDYDVAFAGWLLDELATATMRGALTARLVRSPGGSVAGYFVYYLVPGGISTVVTVAAPDEPSVGIVLDALFADAGARGAAMVHGRLEPRLLEPLAGHRALFRYAPGSLIHAGDPATAALAISRHALLTRMEGEWWMAPHLL